MIEVNGLRSSYGSHLVLDGVDFRVPAGSIFALLGPNGAGKTTTVNVLSTLVAASGGSARVAGIDVRRQPAAVRRVIALTGQYASVDEFQSGRENLAMMARLAHVPHARRAARVAELLARFDLVDAADRRVSTYSGGMRRRLDLAISLVASPLVLFLDEPTTGLDPRSRSALWDIVRQLADDGTTVLLTTQYLEEADRLADRIAVLDAGRIIAEGTADDLKRRIGGDHVTFTFPDEHALRAAQTAGIPGAVVENGISIATDDPAATIRQVLTRLGDVPIAGIDVGGPTLDDVFLSLTGRTASTENQQTEEVAA
jgi:ABC-2 type transport system ATP-binding protein